MNARCVIGIGCDDHGDQVAGLLVARAVRRHAPGRFDVVESGGAPVELIAAWRDADSVVLIEALPGDEPGAVYRCQPHPRGAGAGCSSAQVSPRLREALALGPLPRTVTVVMIAAQCFRADAQVTAAVAAAADDVARDIVAGAADGAAGGMGAGAADDVAGGMGAGAPVRVPAAV